MTCGLFLACQDADRPTLEECGNGIIEPAVSEDCEPVQDPERCGAVGSGAPACRWTCAASECPEGFHCGVDAICRRPCLGHEGEPLCNPFASLSTDVTTADVADVVLTDVIGDARPEIVTVEFTSGQGEAAAHVYTYDGAEFTMHPGAAVGERATLSPLEAGGAPYLLAARGALASDPADTDPSDTRATVSLLTDELRFDEVLMQGPLVVEDGPVALGSYAVPVDVPDLDGQTLLFGFRQDAVWQPGQSTASVQPISAPADLLGPIQARLISTAFADAEGHLASRYCKAMVYGARGETTVLTTNPCAAATGWSAASITPPSLPSGTTLGDGLVATDINGDGLDDLVVTTSDNRIIVSYAVGDGTFHANADALPVAGGDGTFSAGVGLPPTSEALGLGVIAAGDFNADGEPDFLTQSTWIRSCTIPDCGTCDTPGYRCDSGLDRAPLYQATPASVVDFDGDGEIELAVLATDTSDALAGPEAWGPVTPTPGDLVIIDRPGSAQWSARVIPLVEGAQLRARGDLDGDGLDEVVLVRPNADDGDTLVVVFGASERVYEVRDFPQIADVHVAASSQTLAVISANADGSHRRLSTLTATHDQRLRSLIGLELDVVPRTLVAGRFDRSHPDSRGVVAIGEQPDGEVGAELHTRAESSFFDASTRQSAMTPLGVPGALAARVRGIAVDLDGDELDELVVFAPDGAIRTLHVDGASPQFDATVSSTPVAEQYAGPLWPAHGASVGAGSPPQATDLDGDGDDDLWLLTADDPPRLVAFRNTGDGTLDIAGRSIIPVPALSLSTCEDPDCTVYVRAFSPFEGPSERSLSVGPNAHNVLLVSRRALFLWTVDPFDPSTADALEVIELAVVAGNRPPLSPEGGQVLGVVGDIDGDGVDDVVAGGRNGLRWLRGLAVNP